MFTYQQLDFIADSYIPVLFFISLFIFAVDIFRNGFKKHCLQLGSVVLSVLIVYLVMAVDNRFEIWPKFDLDYSTHTALALVFVIFLSSRGTLALTLSVLSFVLYIALMIYQKYHTFDDIFSTALFLAPIFCLLIFSEVIRKRSSKKLHLQ